MAQPEALGIAVSMSRGLRQSIYRLPTLADRMLAVEDYAESEGLEPIVLSPEGELEQAAAVSPRHGVRAR